MTVRVRVAPSPTGELHVGNARAALFNWLYARNRGGVFIVRVDDTDRLRSTPEHERENLESLHWLGLDWDEGVGVGGPHGTYRQSDRLDRYRDVAEQLVSEGAAYPCFCTPEELEARKRHAGDVGRPPGYDGRCRSLDRLEARTRRSLGEAAAIRLAIPRPGKTVFEDLVRETVTFDHGAIDDFVLLRSDGTPTYHLASTVDDIDYEITHVARGEDLLSSTPKHILLIRALGSTPPVYAHMPLLFGPDGKKLSKRHGVTSVSAYRTSGHLPEAMFNYLSLLGWSYHPEQPIFSVEQAISRFDLADVSKNPAVFDPKKLLWMNGEYLRALPVAEFVSRSLPHLEAFHALRARERARFEALAPHIQERVETLSGVREMGAFLLEDGFLPRTESWEKVMSGPEAATALEAALRRLERLKPWETGLIESALRATMDDLGLSPAKGLQPIRVAVTGSHISPPLFESLAVLGRDTSLGRIRTALERLEPAQDGVP